MRKRALPLERVYQLLEPGPVVLLTTARKGRANVMTLSWHAMLDFVPPLVCLVVSRQDYSRGLLNPTKQCVINIPDAPLARAVVGVGNCSGRDADKFARFGLTKVPATVVRPPMIQECFASLECRVVDSSMADVYDLFVVEVIAAWADSRAENPRTLHHRGLGNFMIAGRTLRLPSKMK